MLNAWFNTSKVVQANGDDTANISALPLPSNRAVNPGGLSPFRVQRRRAPLPWATAAIWRA
ncbi:MAG: hypothetical protein V4578_27435, partial [Pseudomonadota bacterium]